MRGVVQCFPLLWQRWAVNPLFSPSSNTQASLLLTAPLLSRAEQRTEDTLTPSEFKKYRQCLRGLDSNPSDLLAPSATTLLAECDGVIPAERVQRLLDRAFLLGPVLDGWQSRSIWVMSSEDENYPRPLIDKLGDNAPAVLYGCGSLSLLDGLGLAVVGSRDVDADALEFTENTGRQAAHSGVKVISGGARGVDQSAMRGALNAGGQAVGVLADGLERAATQRDNREVLFNEQLTLISPFDPAVGFNVGHAMQRNKYIYALAEAGLVISCDLEKGGTWAGAKEQLDKYRFGPLFVRDSLNPSEGIDALRKKGALVWPTPAGPEAFRDALKTPPPIAPQEEPLEAATLFDDFFIGQ